MSTYSELPHDISVETSRFFVNTTKDELQGLMDLLRCSKLGPKTYENMASGGEYGITYEWMSNAKAYWESRFDWSAVEMRINSLPNFISHVIDDDGSTHSIHFIGIFSQRKDAIPLMCIHGWPGSFLEFLGVLSSLMKKYAPGELPYHVIVPSLPGYAFSESPPLDKDWTLQDSARLMHKLMVGLGFGPGYAVQGGDIGSYTARIMASRYDSCKALHLNFCPVTCPDETIHGKLPVEDFEREGLERADAFAKFGTAYGVEHATRPATIGFVLSSNPVALLAWIGEKYLAWSNPPLSLDDILSSVTLYWLTETFPHSIYPYREELIGTPRKFETDTDCREVFRHGPERYMTHADSLLYCHKPFGYSWFPYEIAPIPRAWAATTGNMVWSRHHQKGGHFAALEQPAVLLADIEDFLRQVWV
ncbi:Fc.00g022400.m01.CDS01 [Cosmosporella sp. VM-42]